MDKVYLLQEGTTDYYKIGYTRGSVNNRVKQLQTGASGEISIVNYFESEHAKKIEKNLHNRFKSSHVNGEWFKLPDDFVLHFKD